MTLTPLLGFGLWIFPDMGLAGFGMAMILAQITGAVMNFYALFAGTSRLHLSLRGFRIDPPLLWRLVKIGVPASVTSVQLSVSQIIMLAVVSPFGITAIGAYTLVQRAQQFANMGTMGLGQAAGVLVGQNLGAKRPERARQTVLWAIAYSIVLQGLFGLFLVAFPSLFISIFNSDPDLLSLAETWLRIQVLGYLAMGTGLIFAQSFNTAGDTIPPGCGDRCHGLGCSASPRPDPSGRGKPGAVGHRLGHGHWPFGQAAFLRALLPLRSLAAREVDLGGFQRPPLSG